MRRLVIPASIAAHVALAVAIASWLDGDLAPPPRSTSPAQAVTAVASAPLDIELLPAEPAPPGASRASVRPQLASSRTNAGAIGALVEPTVATGEPVHGSDARLLHMRGPELPDIGDTLDKIAAARTSPLPPPPSGRLRSLPGGNAVIHDRVTTVMIDADGNAHFHDKPDIDIHFIMPFPSLKGLRMEGATISAWVADPYARVRAAATSELPTTERAEPGQCDQFDALGCPNSGDRDNDSGDDDGDLGTIVGVPLPIIAIVGKADITSYLMRKTVGDPYASRKLKLLDATRDERAARGKAHRSEQLSRSSELVRANLARLVAADLTPAARRVALFTLWDECSEGEGAEGEAGDRARAQVIGWIRAHLPVDGPDAFTPDEIATMNRRRGSNQVFSPY